MARTCTRSFDEELISGYLDGALPQMDAQRVRLHVEECGSCKTLLGELETLRETARTTRFHAPGNDEWPELPKTRPARFSRGVGWVVLIAWLLAISGLALWRIVTESGDPWEIFLYLGLPGGVLLLFVSVLLDRLRELKTDRYTGVHR